MPENESSGLVKGALFLTLAGLMSKVLSAGYRIPLQNLTGDIGFYIYQQVYPILGIALILALYGLPSAVSKLTAETKASSKRIFLPVFIILFVVMTFFALLLYVAAGDLAYAIGDAGLTRAYKLAALTLIVIPFTALMRGVHQGHDDMKPTAYSQVAEQFVRVLLIIIAAVYVSQVGTNPYVIGEAASIASFAGGLIACVVLLYFSRNKQITSDNHEQIPWRYYIRIVLFFGFVASLNHMVLLLMQFADSFTLIPALVDYGMVKLDAMEAKGVLDRGQPLIQLGTVLGSSFALAMVPTLTSEKHAANRAQLNENIRSSMKISLFLAVGATVGLIAIMKEANILLYQDDAGTADLQILMLAIFLSATGITMSSILQGLGFIKQTALFILLAVALKWFGNMLLVPLIGITGSALATVGSLLCLSSLLLFELRRKLPDVNIFSSIKWSSLLLAVGSMLLYIFTIDAFLPADLSRFGALLYVLWIGATGAGLYIFMLIRLQAFTKTEIKLLPFSKVALRIFKERNKSE